MRWTTIEGRKQFQWDAWRRDLMLLGWPAFIDLAFHALSSLPWVGMLQPLLGSVGVLGAVVNARTDFGRA